LLEENAIRFHKIGTRWQVRFRDLKSYKYQMDAKRKKAMSELLAEAQELSLGY
jgi:hypothetical protein